MACNEAFQGSTERLAQRVQARNHQQSVEVIQAVAPAAGYVVGEVAGHVGGAIIGGIISGIFED
jgi:uncharacterized membrane protein YoaK (UPF0700 family)